MKIIAQLIFLVACTTNVLAQKPHTASFVAKLGVDTVIVETYNMLPNHLFGKSFLRYPEDRIGTFNFHFYPDGSIKHYSMSFMKPDSSYIVSSGTEGLYCEDDTCTWFSSPTQTDAEYINKRPAKKMDFVGGWTPTLSLIEWNCLRLIKSGKQVLPITMINDYIGIKEVSLKKKSEDSLIFGGNFLEYAKIKISSEGRIVAYDGTGTPWNYIVTKNDPINVDKMALRMSQKPKIGIPSPGANVSFSIGGDTIRLNYGRPFKRGRIIFGGIVPFDSVWRTGANGPTILSLPYDIQFNQTKIPKGVYALYTIPGRTSWKLILNTNLHRWPTEPDRSKDFATIPLQVQKLGKPVDQFTIDIKPDKSGAIIKFTWENTEAFALFKILK
jgi:hypothetical protein